MAKMVGFACPLNIRWLNKSIQLLKENLTEKEYKEQLNEYLSFEIESPTRLRKTREILMNIWYYPSDDFDELRKEAVRLADQYPDFSAAINLCMVYLAYPVVTDICKNMGKIFEYSDTVTNTVMKQKLYDEWGERGSLETTARRVSLTLKELGILENETRVRYKLHKIKINKPEIVSFLLLVAMMIDGNSYYTFSELKEFTILFPFDFDISKEDILNDNRFVSNNFAGEMTISARE